MLGSNKIILITLFTALSAVGAFIKIPIPYIPITMQTFFILLAGVLLGGKCGALSVLCYILLGLIGVPVFAEGGGLTYVFKPTFGYLIGFVIAAFAVGIIVNRTRYPSYKRILFSSFLGLLILYTIGLVYYWLIYTYYIGTGIAFKTLMLYCFVLTIPGDIALSFCVAFLGYRLIPILRKQNIPIAKKVTRRNGADKAEAKTGDVKKAEIHKSLNN